MKKFTPKKNLLKTIFLKKILPLLQLMTLSLNHLKTLKSKPKSKTPKVLTMKRKNLLDTVVAEEPKDVDPQDPLAADL